MRSTCWKRTLKSLTDAELRGETDTLKQRYQDGDQLDDLLPEAFAAVREAASRTLGLRHFDVQLMGGAALHLGNIAEMKTGEGKTLVATAPAYLNALTGKGVHVVTVNDYLAELPVRADGPRVPRPRHDDRLHPVRPDPASAASSTPRTSPTARTTSSASTTCATTWPGAADDLVQRGHHFAIVDEVDSILIDEARTPLIISGPASGEANRWFTRVRQASRSGSGHGEDYEVDEKKRTVGVLEPGIEKVEDYLGIDNLYESANTPLISFLNNAIKAKALFKRDKDYVVMNGEVLIVDEHTGRILVGRRYNEGIHQAIEAKEGVEVKAENQTLATVTLQNYFRLYEKLSGMTGTAETEAAEFMCTYKLGVVPIPTNKPMVRNDQSDLVYKNEIAKFDAVVEGHRRAPREGPAGAGRHHQRREERVPLASCSPSGASSTRCSTRRTTRVRRRSSPRPAAWARSPSPPTWPAAAPTSCSAATPSSSPSPR